MSLFARGDSPTETDRHGPARVRVEARRVRRQRALALAEFAEDVGILIRYATGRDYYDRQTVCPKH